MKILRASCGRMKHEYNTKRDRRYYFFYPSTCWEWTLNRDSIHRSPSLFCSHSLVFRCVLLSKRSEMPKLYRMSTKQQKPDQLHVVKESKISEYLRIKTTSIIASVARRIRSISNDSLLSIHWMHLERLYIHQMAHSLINFKLFQFQFAASKQTPVINYGLTKISNVWDAERETERIISAEIKARIWMDEVDEEMKQQAKEKQTIMAIKTTVTNVLCRFLCLLRIFHRHRHVNRG